MAKKLDGFSIQKFVGVSPQQLANLHEVLRDERVRKHSYINGEGESYAV